MKCLKCEKEIFHLDNMPNNFGGGELVARFDYGSRHDMIGQTLNPSNRIDNLLACDRLVAYICDDCFEKHSDLFDGYANKTEVKFEKVV